MNWSVKKIRVSYIVILVVFAMIALLLIQAFQTSQLYHKKSTQFRNEVETALERIAVRHEKAEDVRKFLNIANTNFSGNYKDILKEEFQNLLSAQESIAIRDTAIMEGGKLENYLVIQGESFDSLSGVTTEQRVLARDARHLRDLYQGGAYVSKDSLNIAIKLDQMVVKKMFEKAKYVNAMMMQAFRENVLEEAQNRFDVFFLDSVIRNEFKDDHLPSDFRFMVTTESNRRVDFGKKLANYSINLDTADCFHTQLLPGNVFTEKLTLHVFFPKQSTILLKEMWLPLLVNLTLVVMIVWALVFMFRTILSQKKLAELKNDFISNMTHEFKTPISTISLACQAMNDPDMSGNSTEQIKPYVKMINDENKRLGLLVERILQSAILDRGEVNLKMEKVLLNEIIHEIVYNAQFRIQKEGGKIEMELDPELIYIQADRLHLTNTISNLIDNAIKYSESAPVVKIGMTKSNNLIKIWVSDEGPGIKKEHLTKIFDKLYRIPTGNIHNVKGFGLGLSYVKAICDLHHWNVRVQSKFGEGATFILEIKQEA